MKRLLLIIAALCLLAAGTDRVQADDEECPTWSYTVRFPDQSQHWSYGFATEEEAQEAMERWLREEATGAPIFQTVYCGDHLTESPEPDDEIEAEIEPEPIDHEALIADALEQIPSSWNVTRDTIAVIDCADGASSTGWGAVDWSYCRRGYAGWAYITSREIVLNAAYPDFWQSIIAHEAVHVAHAQYCNLQTRSQGPPRPLVLALWRLYKGYRGTFAQYESVCVRPVFNFGNSWAATQARHAALPAGNRPVTAYALTNFWEYLAETIEAWIISPDWLLGEDPRAHAAVEEHGLGSD